MSNLKRQRIDGNDSLSPANASHVSGNGKTASGTSNNGDSGGRIPKVSRKIHACTECQGRKIKCDIEPPHKKICSRCQKKGLKCVVNKSLQSLLEEDTAWKTNLEQNTQSLSLAVSQILSVLNLPDLEAFQQQVQQNQLLSDGQAPSISGTPAAKDEPQSVPSATSRTAAMAMTRENSQDPEQVRTHDALVTDPMGALYEVTKLRNLRANSFGRSNRPRQLSVLESDFISKGVVTQAQAEEMFRVFNTSLNHYLWGGVALVHDNLTSVRRSSPLLAAAIITVTALHIPGNEKLFDVGYAQFTSLVSDTMFARYHNLDEIRALAIGAFWLSDVSWNLSGHAVRIATELNLHQNYSRAMRGSREHLEGAKLWYFLYVCDHHFSIAYGRPPVIQEDMTITNHEKFLELAGINQGDVRLHSQIAIFIILTRVYNTFGPDIEEMVQDEDIVRLQHFNAALDMWRSNWTHRLAPNLYVATYPAKGVDLHHYFGKLQVSSLSLRGIQRGALHDLSPQRRELANTAISCAQSILRMSLDDPDVRNSVVGVPIYLHTMIAYSSVFLLKARQKSETYNLAADPQLILDLVTRIIELLFDARAGERHLSGHIATGLKKMLDRMTSRDSSQKPGEPQLQEPGSDYLHNPDPQMWGGQNYFGVPDNLNNGVLRMFDESALFSHENFFPLGFFDAVPATQLDMDYRQREM